MEYIKQGTGSVPERTLLAAAYVPVQSLRKTYNPDDALMRGTLFPELDLPWYNKGNTRPIVDSGLERLMALDFTCHELRLFLDTHPSNSEALHEFNQVIMQANELREKIERHSGPLTERVPYTAEHNYLQGPWPWEC